MNTFENYFTMHLLFSDLSKEDAFFIECYLINSLPTYTPYGYNKAKDEYRLQFKEKFIKNKPELYKRLLDKEEFLKSKYYANIWNW